MDTSADAPYLDCAYKLVEYGGKARRKRSEGKVLWPGRKQVYRNYDADGCMRGDVLSLENDPQEGEPLIQPFMQDGTRLAASKPLNKLREHALEQIKRLPQRLRTLERDGEYPVTVADTIRRLAHLVDAEHGKSDLDAREENLLRTRN
jgi:nicotinate phosphoribosyltransferase